MAFTKKSRILVFLGIEEIVQQVNCQESKGECLEQNISKVIVENIAMRAYAVKGQRKSLKELVRRDADAYIN